MRSFQVNCVWQVFTPPTPTSDSKADTPGSIVKRQLRSRSGDFSLVSIFIIPPQETTEEMSWSRIGKEIPYILY